jgi:hypothetical protein
MLALLPLACGEEEGDTDDGDDAPAVIRSCDDMPPDDFGEAVTFETLRCGDKEMKGFVSGSWSGAGTDRLFTDLTGC